MEDRQQLRRFCEEGSQEAFAELVRARIGLVYAAALRQTGGDAHLAQDVTQAVFLALAANAVRLQRHATLTGWLFTTTRFLASKAVRTQHRWQRREKEANTMNAELEGGEPGWENLRPVIDEALHELAAKDRDAILLRFFEGRTFGEIGTLTGVGEGAARMRVERAVEKLKVQLGRRGIGSTAAALGVVLASQPVVAVPAGLAASATGAGLAAALGAGGAVSALAATLMFMSTAKLVLGAAALVALGAWGGYLSAQYAPWTAPMPDLRTVDVGNARESAVPLRVGAAAAAAPTLPVDAAMANHAAPGKLDPLRALVELQRLKLASSEAKLVEDGGLVTGQFRELFGLTAGETAALQQGLDDARKQVAVLMQKNATLSTLPDGSLQFEMKAFPEAGGLAYDQMLKVFATTLGPERYQAFLALGAEQAEKSLDRFGTPYRVATVSRQTTADGEVRYRIRSRENATPENNSNYLSDWMTYDRLAAEAEWLARMLPPEFAPRR